MTEIWKSVAGWDGYEVSNLGRVRSWNLSGRTLKKRKIPLIRKLVLSIYGYFQVMLSDQSNGRLKLFTVHVLVLETFSCKRPIGLEACHWDGVKTNNNILNLRWDTPKSNQNDKLRHGTDQFGERNSAAKLTSSQVIAIKNSKEKCRVLAAKFGVKEPQISRIRNGLRRARG